MDSSRRSLPLFPLSLVQFPGAITPLHIFEPRYRKLLKDVSESDKIFGIIYQRPDETVIGEEPVRVGCSVEVVATHELEDGRSNIVCVGMQRFRVLRYIETESYQQAEIEFFDDEPLLDEVDDEVESISRLLWRVITMGRRLGEVSGVPDEEPPEFPSDPQLFSTTICSYLEIELEEKQDLLELTNTTERLEHVRRILESLAADYERRVFVQEVAKKNGHTGTDPADL